MGERVYVKTVRAEPATADDEGVRIDYAKSDVNPLFPTFHKAVAWVRYAAAEVWAELEPRLAVLRHSLAEWAQRIGGARQLGFALGMMFVLGGLGSAISPPRGDTGFWMAIGGLLIGLCVRVSHPKG
jgi:hypothetical protein